MTQATISAPNQTSAPPETATNYRMVMPHQLCHYGLKALDLLKRKGISERFRFV